MFVDGRMVVLLAQSVLFTFFWFKLGLALASTDTLQVGSSHI